MQSERHEEQAAWSTARAKRGVGSVVYCPSEARNRQRGLLSERSEEQAAWSSASCLRRPLPCTAGSSKIYSPPAPLLTLHYEMESPPAPPLASHYEIELLAAPRFTSLRSGMLSGNSKSHLRSQIFSRAYRRERIPPLSPISTPSINNLPKIGKL